MADLRETLAAGLDAIEPIERPAEPTEVSAPPPATETVSVASTSEVGRTRDEAGRFTAAQADAKPDATAQPAPAPLPVEPAPNRPSTWKKEYWGVYDKLAQGQALTPEEAKQLAAYTNQRENEFKSGVSTYRAEAEKAKEIQAAIAPFLPELQRYNINPGQWIQNLGQAHQTLALGSPSEKLVMFRRLAQEYHIPLGSLAEGAEAPQVDPQLQWLTNELNQVRSGFNSLQTNLQRQQEAVTQAEIQKFASDTQHSHFEAVREQMAGLLQAGLAQGLEDAYAKAVRMNDEVWSQQQAESDRQRAAQASQQSAQAVAKAKAAAVSPRSASPSVTGNSQAKGLRAQLEDGVNSLLGGGRV